MSQVPNDETQHRIARQFVEMIPHTKALGMTVEAISREGAVIWMDWDARFVGDPRTGVIHGGVVSALMDTCCGAAAMGFEPNVTAAATIDLRIDYMRAARPHQRITARAKCYHMTRSVAFVRAWATDDDAANPVATATGAFTVTR